MARSTPFTPCRLVTGIAFLSAVGIFLFQNSVIDALKQMHRDSCEGTAASNTPSIFNSHISPYTFPKVSRLEDLSEDGDQAWAGLTTQKGGFLWVEYNETYRIRWGITMFHGLHCLQMLRAEFQQQLGLTTNGGSHHHHHSHGGRNIATQYERGRADADLIHLGHCLAYVAEMVRCVGDSTIEKPWINFDERGHIRDTGIDGTGVQHQCRNVNHLWEAAENTEQRAVKMWDHRPGDTIESVFR